MLKSEQPMLIPIIYQVKFLKKDSVKYANIWELSLTM